MTPNDWLLYITLSRDSSRNFLGRLCGVFSPGILTLRVRTEAETQRVSTLLESMMVMTQTESLPK